MYFTLDLGLCASKRCTVLFEFKMCCCPLLFYSQYGLSCGHTTPFILDTSCQTIVKHQILFNHNSCLIANAKQALSTDSV